MLAPKLGGLQHIARIPRCALHREYRARAQVIAVPSELTAQRRTLPAISSALALALAFALASSAPAYSAPAHSAAAYSAQAVPLDDPVADPRAVVVMGKARFTVLTPNLIRLEWAADGQFEDHASLVFINRHLPAPPFTQQLSGGGQKLTIKTSALTLTYSPGGSGEFTPDNLAIDFNLKGRLVGWHPGMVDPENLLGTTRTLDGAMGDKVKEPMEPGLVSRSGWALVDDSARPLFDGADFRFLQGERSPWPWVLQRPGGERQDWYFFGYGHDYRRALGEYVRVAGRIPLPPRFALGAWWSRYWAYSDQEIEAIVGDFRGRNVPLDVVVIDMDWHPTYLSEQQQLDASGHGKGWTGYSWNRLLFPEPESFLAKLHAAGLKTSLNLHPASGIQPWEDRYPEMARAMGVDPQSQQYIPFDITNQRFTRNYFDVIHHPLEQQGIDFWWLDWQQEPTTKVPGVSPTWWLNYVHFTDQQREGKRPLLFHRWGGLGNHRYQIGFSGDTFSAWDSLAFQPWFTATATNVGYAYWSHDIGGHQPGPVDPELFTRWVQFGAFSPVLRTHTTKNPEAERRIWAYPEPYASIMRTAFQLRYALQPYLYTEARRTYDTGVAFLHPLYYDWPEAEEAYTARGEYVFGQQMLVAPVTQPMDRAGLVTQRVWLPEGEWIEWPTGKHLNGPATFSRRFSAEQIPVYLRAGAIVPMQPPMSYTGEKPVDPLIINVWPLLPGQNTRYEVYEDSGVAVDYQRGVWTRTHIAASQAGDELRVQIEPVEGHFPGMLRQRRYQLRLPADWPPLSVSVNGALLKPIAAGGTDNAVGWRFEGNSLTTVIQVASQKVGNGTTIVVRRAPGLTARRKELDGFAGLMTRLRAATAVLREPARQANVPDAVLDALQTGDRLGYHPERVEAEITRLHTLVGQVCQLSPTIDLEGQCNHAH
jgi:alpha-glucosidase (family GH31 glycosyl hydrolase)